MTIAQYRQTSIALMQAGATRRDLTQRQTVVLLTCYIEPSQQTVRGLADRLDLSKPVISRAVDVLAREGLLRRKTDKDDRRSVLVCHTAKGMQLITRLFGEPEADRKAA
jgi:DNA-binding MarR family transcriptional regulator